MSKVSKKKQKLPTKQKPLVLKIAPDRLHKALFAVQCIKTYTLRKERKEALTALLFAMVEHCSLAHDGAVVFKLYDERNTLYMPITVAKLAELAELGIRRTWRALHDLTKAGLVQSPKQIRKPVGKGLLKVSIVQRSLTAKFWDLLGLTDQYLHDCKYCVKKGVEAIKTFFVKITTGKRSNTPDTEQERKETKRKPVKQQIVDLIEFLKRNGDQAEAEQLRLAHGLP